MSEVLGKGVMYWLGFVLCWQIEDVLYTYLVVSSDLTTDILQIRRAQSLIVGYKWLPVRSVGRRGCAEHLEKVVVLCV